MIMEKRCSFCHGQGTVPDPQGVLSSRAACPICAGRKFNLVPRDANPCGFCKSLGKIEGEGGEAKICPDCHGIGFIW
jgi:DnaJ-class molecular chaperone